MNRLFATALGEPHRAPRGVVALACALSFVACNTATPHVQTMTPARITEGERTTVTFATDGCSPRFDLDRGEVVGMNATLRLNGNESMFTLTRIQQDSFSATLGDELVPGRYALDIVLDDGRVAASDAPLEVVPVDPVLTSIDSPRGALAFGDTGIPFTVTFRNDSACSVVGLHVSPTFQQGAKLPLTVHGPAMVDLAPHATLEVGYDVDLDSTVTAGMLVVNATGTGGTRSGGTGCFGTVDAVDQATNLVWVVVPQDHQSIAVTGIQFTPREPRSGGVVTMQVTLRNDASTDLTLERIDVASDPTGFGASTSSLPSRTLAPGASSSVSVNVMAPDVTATTTYRVSISVSARDGSGTLYNSPPHAGSVDIVVQPR